MKGTSNTKNTIGYREKLENQTDPVAKYWIQKHDEDLQNNPQNYNDITTKQYWDNKWRK